MDLISLRNELGRDEGRRNRRYLDTTGHWTIGIGHNIDADPAYPYTMADEPLSDDQIDNLFWNDIQGAIAELDNRWPWYLQMTDARQRVLANMCFNLGGKKLAGFVNTLKAMREGRYLQAAAGMRSSLWAKQVGLGTYEKPGRAERLARMMERG